MKLSIQPNIILLLIYYAELQNQAHDYYEIENGLCMATDVTASL